MDINFNLLLQSVSLETPDIAIEYNSEEEFQINHELITISDNLVKFNGTVLRVNDPRDFLFELRAERILKINTEKLKSILKTYHHLYRHARNKNI